MTNRTTQSLGSPGGDFHRRFTIMPGIYATGCVATDEHFIISRYRVIFRFSSTLAIAENAHE